MKHSFIFLRACASLLVLILLASVLVSCGTNPHRPYETDVIGTVDGRDVCYDELYFLVSRYMESAKKTCGADTEALGAELDKLFRENVLSTYAMLRLCEDHGLTLDENEWKDEIDAEVDAYVYEYFNEDGKLMDEEMERIGLSERYLRYLLATDLLYSRLLYVYPEQGLVPSGEKELKNLIQKKFIHVYHIVIFDDEGDDPAKNLQKIQEAQERLSSGQTTMYSLIKSGASEDFSDVSASGEYIVRGTMDELYEEAAFSLRIGEVSDVITTVGVNNQNKTVPCHYVIQRFEHDTDYLESHYSELVNEYYGSVIATDLAEVEKTMSFEPNEFYQSLDLTDLAKPRKFNTTLVILLSVVGGTLLIGGVIFVIVVKQKHKKKNANYQAKRLTGAKGERHEQS